MVSAVLAGGKNTRLPFPKGLMEVKGRRLVESSVRILGEITGHVVISTNAPERYFNLGVPLIGDVVESRGPISGILSVLLSTGAEEAFFIACDMPFIKTELIRYIIDRRSGDATVPVFGGRPEPLFAVYSRKVAGVFEERIIDGGSSLVEAIKGLDVRYIEEDEVRRIDPEGRSFININTIEDYEGILQTENF
jgi:molybdopterin-guanine dinucleotide biosynthesis protein A